MLLAATLRLMSLEGPHSLSLRQRLRRGQSLRALLAELFRFGAVGAVAFVVDVGLFNLLRFGPGGLLADQPLTAKTLAVSAAMLTAWLGHRLWTFSRTRRHRRGSELVLFVAVNLAAMGIAVGCLAVSHYVLGFTSALADNISANGVGLVLGTAFRYVCYRYLVFAEPASAAPAAPANGDEATLR
ncbi:putative flippase GtrA [Bogoriella caseilytica]|uniref:Putative flippase GtrA n=2 Tax=Bogoriella caseilytica TaxID=56055 RepID=A0A3N2BAA9_9MICO|nr:putative flippase GtrA [Bogoriella caseilytica]